MLKLHRQIDGVEFLANMHQVQSVMPLDRGGACLIFNGEDEIDTRETVDEIFALISPPPVPA